MKIHRMNLSLELSATVSTEEASKRVKAWLETQAWAEVEQIQANSIQEKKPEPVVPHAEKEPVSEGGQKPKKGWLGR